MSICTLIKQDNQYNITDRKIGTYQGGYFVTPNTNMYMWPIDFDERKKVKKVFNLHKNLQSLNLKKVNAYDFMPLELGCFIIEGGKLKTVYPTHEGTFMLNHLICENTDSHGMKMTSPDKSFQCEYIDSRYILERLQELAIELNAPMVIDVRYFEISLHLDIDKCKLISEKKENGKIETTYRTPSEIEFTNIEDTTGQTAKYFLQVYPKK
jgi:hypothetical protein